MTCIHYEKRIESLRNYIKNLKDELENYYELRINISNISSDISNVVESLTFLGNLCKEIILNGSSFDEGQFEVFANLLKLIITEIGIISGAISKCIIEIDEEIFHVQEAISSYNGKDCSECQKDDNKEKYLHGSGR